jgi:hypothetical protein
MKCSIVLSTAALLLSLAATPSFAEGPPAEPTPSLEEMICARYGPGFRIIPGTSTCVRVRASIQVDTRIWSDDADSSGSSGKGKGASR